jgi:biopolymer transport protein ExbD
MRHISVKNATGKSILRKILKSKFSILLILIAPVILLNVSGIYAQKSKPSKKSAKKKTPTFKPSKIDTVGDLCVPKEKNLESLIAIDENSEITYQANMNPEMPSETESLKSLPDILSRLNKNATVIFRADSALDFGMIRKVLFDIRHATENCVKIDVQDENGSEFVYLSRKPEKNQELRPNPLMLIAELDENKNINLNNDESGSLRDTSPLINYLKRIFKARQDNGVFRAATNEIETTVLVNVSDSNKFGDVLKMVNAVRESGASQIGIMIDEPQTNMIQIN